MCIACELYQQCSCVCVCAPAGALSAEEDNISTGCLGSHQQDSVLCAGATEETFTRRGEPSAPGDLSV